MIMTYLDFGKAFDHVSLAHLISKLFGYEINGLLEDLLTNRKQVCA